MKGEKNERGGKMRGKSLRIIKLFNFVRGEKSLLLPTIFGSILQSESSFYFSLPFSFSFFFFFLASFFLTLLLLSGEILFDKKFQILNQRR